MRRLLSGPALVILLIAAACLGASPAAAAEKRAGPEADALILGRAASPALKALRSAADLDTTRGAEVDRLRPQRYDMLVVDGHHLTADELRRRPSLQNFVAANRWIAAFDVRPSDHEALRTYTGFDVADGEGNDRSEMFVFRVSKAEGTPTVEMINAGPYAQPDSARLGNRREAMLNHGHLRRIAQLVDGQLDSESATFPRAARATKFERLACDPLDPPPDPELQHVGFCYWDTGTAPTPRGYWTEKSNPWWLEWLKGSHAPGSQTATWTFTHRFDVFLNNDAAHPRGNFQTVYYRLDGKFNPIQEGEQFFRMNRQEDKIKYLFDSLFPERAWWTAKIEPRVTPSSATSAKLLWQASQPESPNSVTQYSSGEEFSIGFTGTGTAGNLQNVANVTAGLNFGYTTSKTKSWEIPDWSVANKGSGNELRWLFYARQPCDTTNTSRISSDCFEPAARTVQPRMPKQRSLEQIQVHASGRWRTREQLPIQSTNTNASLAFTLATPIALFDTYCIPVHSEGAFLIVDACHRPTYQQHQISSANDVTIDASLVNPIPIKELKLSPNPANGAKGDKVTGTVILERAASIPVTVKLFSNSANAVLPSPLAGVNNGTQGTITIDAGKTSGNFTLSTNDNRLAAGQHTTANITASYVEATNAQLRVERP